MSTAPIHSSNSARFTFPTFPIRVSSRLWTNLTGSHPTLMKYAGITALILGFMWWVYKPRTNPKVDRDSFPSSPVSAQSSVAEPILPDGVKQAEVDEAIQLMTSHYKTYINDTSEYRLNPTQKEFYQGDFREVVKNQGNCNSDAAVVNTAVIKLFKYLCTIEILESYSPLRGGNFQLNFHKKFIQSLQNSSNLSNGLMKY